MANFLPAEQVQEFLDNLQPSEPFVVKFLKQGPTEEERVLIGNLDPTGTTRKTAVPMQTEEGWKSFLIHRVIAINRARPLD